MQRVSLGSAAAASAAGAAQQQQAPKQSAVAPASTMASTQVGPNGMAPKRLGPVAVDGSTMSKVSTAGRMLGVTAARAGESTAAQGTHVRPHAHPHTQSPTPPWPLQAKADREKQKQNPAYREKERVSVVGVSWVCKEREVTRGRSACACACAELRLSACLAQCGGEPGGETPEGARTLPPTPAQARKQANMDRKMAERR